MSRVKGGVNTLKTRRNILRKVKGFRFGRSKKEAAAYEALAHAGRYAFAHRRTKKNDFRRLWNIKIGAALKEKGLSYSKFIGAMKKKNVAVDRKIMADLAESKPESFARLVTEVTE